MKTKLILYILLVYCLNIHATIIKSGDEYFDNAIGEYIQKDGIFYRIDGQYNTGSEYFNEIIRKYDNVCYVTANPNGYSGNLTIPATVEYEGITYTVVGDYPAEIKTWYSTERIYCFENCTDLKSVNLPSTFVDLRSGFSDCFNLESLTIPDDMIPIYVNSLVNTAWYKSQPNGDIYLCNTYMGYKGGIEDPTELNIREGTVSIAAAACKDMHGLKKINLPNTIKYIGSVAFDGTSIEEIDLPNSIKVLCDYCISAPYLYSIDIPNSIEEICDYAFNSCDRLIEISFPNKFFYCSSSSFPKIWYDFKNDGHIIIGDNIYLCYKGYIRDRAILELPETVKYIAADAFREDYNVNQYRNIQELILPNTLYGIGTGAFVGLNIYNLSIPEGVENLRSPIGSCSLKMLELPSSLKTVNGLLSNSTCNDIFCKAAEVPKAKMDLSNYVEFFNTCTLHVPAKSLNAYRSDHFWGRFKNIVADNSSVETIHEENYNDTIQIYDLNGCLIYAGTLKRMKEDFTHKGIFVIKNKDKSKIIYKN